MGRARGLRRIRVLCRFHDNSKPAPPRGPTSDSEHIVSASGAIPAAVPDQNRGREASERVKTKARLPSGDHKNRHEDLPLRHPTPTLSPALHLSLSSACDLHAALQRLGSKIFDVWILV
jgi:hypothetical protein